MNKYRAKSRHTSEPYGYIRVDCDYCGRRHKRNFCKKKYLADKAKNKKPFKRPCERCGKTFPRQGEFQKICKACFKRSFKKQVRRTKYSHRGSTPATIVKIVNLDDEEIKL